MAVEDGSTTIRVVYQKHIVDLATIFGIATAFILVIIAIITGGAASSFINPPSVLIVVGGTFGVIVASYNFKDITASARYTTRIFGRTLLLPSEVGMQLIDLGVAGRQRGLLQLQKVMDSISDKPLLYKGLALAIDGASDEEIENIMSSEARNTKETRERSISILRKAADISPAMGLIGTLVGLVQMLANLDDPSTIGPSMAVALLTTFYGVILSNMVFTPFANKLDRNGSDEDLLNKMYVLAAGSIQRQENPRRLEMLFNAILPKKEQVAYFE